MGLIQEQHPDRCRLFMQWHQIDWPVMVDSYNELGVAVVPITVLIDEYGIVRDMPRGRDAKSIVEQFLASTFEPPSDEPPSEVIDTDVKALHGRAVETDAADAWAAYGVATAKWVPEQVDSVVDSLQSVVNAQPDSGIAHFQLGVAYRKRFDSQHRQPGDFQEAAEHWSRALAIDPNQYIWRRRIQQYGPRLDKPYPFYDWVPAAREAVIQRGEKPVKLTVEPGGSEYAYPQRSFESADTGASPPADLGRITAIEGGLIEADVAVVPAIVEPGKAARVHVTYAPVAGKAHWNNEVEPLIAWIMPPSGWRVDRQNSTVLSAAGVTSNEARTTEFEIQVPEDAQPGQQSIAVVALYYMCTDIDGVCLYRRHPVEAMLTIIEK